MGQAAIGGHVVYRKTHETRYPDGRVMVTTEESSRPPIGGWTLGILKEVILAGGVRVTTIRRRQPACRTFSKHSKRRGNSGERTPERCRPPSVGSGS
jgi:hypothetical protein